MNALSADIADLITSNSSYALGVNVYCNNMPTQPINCIVIYDTSSQEPDNTMDKNTAWNEAIQIIVRNTSYLTAISISQDIINIIHNRSNVEINGTYYYYIFLNNGPTKLTSDINTTKGESLYSLNFRIKRS